MFPPCLLFRRSIKEGYTLSTRKVGTNRQYITNSLTKQQSFPSRKTHFRAQHRSFGIMQSKKFKGKLKTQVVYTGSFVVNGLDKIITGTMVEELPRLVRADNRDAHSHVSGSTQIQLSASSRGITDHFFCFTCEEFVWDCEHLIEERVSAARIAALEGSQLHSFSYDGKLRLLEIEFV
jgi:hypothetical protein